jgi:hypothetical protein
LLKAVIAVAKLSQIRQITDSTSQIKTSIDRFSFFGDAVRLTRFYKSDIQLAGLLNRREFGALS